MIIFAFVLEGFLIGRSLALSGVEKADVRMVKAMEKMRINIQSIFFLYVSHILKKFGNELIDKYQK
jgi:hypothetical protein